MAAIAHRELVLKATCAYTQGTRCATESTASKTALSVVQSRIQVGMPGTGATWGPLHMGVGRANLWRALDAHGLHACPFDLLSTPATRATPRSDVGRDAKVIPLSAPRNGLHHRLPRARGRLSDARELGPMPVGHGEKPGSAATSAGASWRAPSTAEGVGAVYDRAETGPPPEKGAQCFSSQLYPACLVGS